MDSISDQAFEKLFRRVDRLVSLKGAFSYAEVNNRLDHATELRPFDRRIRTLNENGVVYRLASHYLEGKAEIVQQRSYNETSRFIYQRMRGQV
jgi:hypothetical protein